MHRFLVRVGGSHSTPTSSLAHAQCATIRMNMVYDMRMLRTQDGLFVAPPPEVQDRWVTSDMQCTENSMGNYYNLLITSSPRCGHSR